MAHALPRRARDSRGRADARLHQDAARRASTEDDDLVFSAIIGIVEVVDSVEKGRSKWFMGPCGLVLRNARPLEKPVPCTGKLGLWNVPPEVERRVRRRLG